MGLGETVSGERVHIGFFGRRNAGKSSLVNAVTGQALSVVSPVKGTTTDPVMKAMELLPLGPVVIMDTPGLDDEGELGNLRVKKARQILAKTDIAVVVVDAATGIQEEERELITALRAKQIPFLIACNKMDLCPSGRPAKEHDGQRPTEETGPEEFVSAVKEETAPEVPVGTVKEETAPEIYVSALTGEGIQELKEKMASLGERAKGEQKRLLIADLLVSGDVVILVTPIDQSAPKGRLILPQQQTLRELLDAHCIPVVCQDGELGQTMKALRSKPRLVITDSQVFESAARQVPPDVMLTSFSILFARYKGNLESFVRGAQKISGLKDGDRVLISEGCTHHRQCGDIGSVKLPRWLERFTGAKLKYTFTSGGEFPENLSEFALIVHCGGCMLGGQEMKHRIECAGRAQVPMVNYGMAIAQMNGILERSLGIFATHHCGL